MKYLGVPQTGSHAATTASRNRYGQYYRNRAIPVNPRTTPQTAHRALFSSVSSVWRGLSASDQAAWSAFAVQVPFTDSLGQVLVLSGHGAFVRCNVILQSAAAAVLSVPGAVPILPATFTESSLVNATGVFSSIFSPSPVPSDNALQIQATAGKSFGVSYFSPSDFRTLGYFAAADVTPSTSPYVAVWGTVPAVGLVVCVRSRMIDLLSGVTTPWRFQRVVVT